MKLTSFARRKIILLQLFYIVSKSDIRNYFVVLRNISAERDARQLINQCKIILDKNISFSKTKLSKHLKRQISLVVEMSFVIYDLVFLTLFILAVIFFLHRGRKNVQRQGILFLYKTKWGIKIMDSFARKNQKWLFPTRYAVIAVGYALMATIIWMMIESVYIYLRFPVTEITKAPPIAPLIPYFPELFGISSFFPPFYFTYFIIAVAIGGVIHEFSHGIFARLVKLKVGSTGFAFLGPFLGAFVEPDEKKMKKSKKINQLAIMGAGTFSNVVVAVFFALIMWVFFAANFSIAGVGFNQYPSVVLNISQISIPNNLNLSEQLIEIESGESVYLANPKLLQEALDKNFERILVYEDAPAVRAQLKGAITEIDGEKIKSFEELSRVIKSHAPGENVSISMAAKDGLFDIAPEFKDYNVQLGEKNGVAFLGIGVGRQTRQGFISSMWMFIHSGASTLDFSLHYESKIGEFGWFIYYLLWWVFMINILLALFNMLPLGILDGGRFLQVGVEGVTKNERIGKAAYSLFTWIILLALAAMMVKWAFAVF